MVFYIALHCEGAFVFCVFVVPGEGDERMRGIRVCSEVPVEGEGGSERREWDTDVVEVYRCVWEGVERGAKGGEKE